MRPTLQLLLVCQLLNLSIAASYAQGDPSSAVADPNFYDVPAPGRMVDLGGYSLHINCQGTGSPTVILDAGIGDWSTHWTAVQNLLKADTRVCSYDRAGYGWSEPGPRPRDSSRIAGELHSLLDKARIDPPYILVGHSFGGFNMRLFASTYPDEVAGLVLVDASHQGSLTLQRNPDGSIPSTGMSGNQLMAIQPTNEEDLKFPAEAQAAIHDNLLHTKSMVTARSEFRSLGFSVQELKQSAPLGHLPLIVLTRGKRVWPDDAIGNAKEKNWQDEQAELVKLSYNSSQRIALNSGHHIHLDEPKVVADAIRDLTIMARKQQTAASAPATDKNANLNQTP